MKVHFVYLFHTKGEMQLEENLAREEIYSEQETMICLGPRYLSDTFHTQRELNSFWWTQVVQKKCYKQEMSDFLPKTHLQAMFNYPCTCSYKKQETCHCITSSIISVAYSVGFQTSRLSLKVLLKAKNIQTCFFGRSPNSMKIILLNEPEQTQLIKHNFDNEHYHFTFK